MIISLCIFIAALTGLLVSARFFTNAAENIGRYMGLPPFVVGVFIVGIGTSLPELISGLFSVNSGVSEIVSGNIIGANISNILLVTGMAVALNRKTITLNSSYLYIDLHFLLGAFVFFCIVAYDGNIGFVESFTGLLMFIIYSIYLIKGGAETDVDIKEKPVTLPVKDIVVLIACSVAIYFGADYTISSLTSIATYAGIPNSIVALTLLSLGTTLPELAVNISAIRQGKAEMAIGNVLGSCIFNTLVIPGLCSMVSIVHVPVELLHFSLPLMAMCGLFFYLLTQDKKISVWEGLVLISLYMLFVIKTTTGK